MAESSNHRPLTGSGRAHSSTVTVHNIGSGLTVLSSVFFAIVLLCTLTGMPGGNSPSAMTPGYVGAPRNNRCNVFQQPGYIAHNPYPVWKSYDPDCESPTIFPDLLALTPGAKMGTAASLRSQTLSTKAKDDVIRTVKNRTVVLVGDAVDRAMIHDLCAMFNEQPIPVDVSHPWGSSLKMPAIKQGKSAQGALLADYCVLPEFSTIFTSFYHYGADTDELWRTQPEYYPPGLFEDRVTTLLKPYLDAMALRSVNGVKAKSNRPDLIVFSSNLWDLAAWAMEDERAHLDATGDLSDIRLNWWRSRMVDMIEAVRLQINPSVPLAWRSAHVPMTKVNDTVEWFFSSMHSTTMPAPIEAGHQFATPNRVMQLNNARRSMLQLTGRDGLRGLRSKTMWSASKQPRLRDIPFGEVTLGQSMNQENLLNPGLESHSYLFWSIVLAELYDSLS